MLYNLFKTRIYSGIINGCNISIDARRKQNVKESDITL